MNQNQSSTKIATPPKSTTTTTIGPGLEISLTTSISPGRSDAIGKNGKMNVKMSVDKNAREDRHIYISRNDCRIIQNGHFARINNLSNISNVRNSVGWVVTNVGLEEGKVDWGNLF
ncbi:hypothetical protein ABKA04_003281 [Annulohypoxylon sp. FPYF3050]